MKFKFTLAFLLMLMCSFGLQLSAQDACDNLQIIVGSDAIVCDDGTGLTTMSVFITGGSGNYSVSLNDGGTSETNGLYDILENTSDAEFPVNILVTDDDDGCTAVLDTILPICSKLCDGEAGELTGLAPGGSYCSGQSVMVGVTGIDNVPTGTFAQTFILVSGDDIVAVDDDGDFGTLADGSYCLYQYSYIYNNAVTPEDVGVYPGDYTSFTEFADAVQLAPVCSDLGDADGNCTAVEVSSATLVVNASEPLCDEQTQITSVNFIISGGSGDYDYSLNGGTDYDQVPGTSVALDFVDGTSISFIVKDNETGCTSNVIDAEYLGCTKPCDADAGTVDGPTTYCEGDDVSGYTASGIQASVLFAITYAAVDGDGNVVATDENGDFGALAAGTYCIHSIQYVVIAGNPVTVGIMASDLLNVECIELSECLPIEVTAAPVADPAGPTDSVCDGTDFALSAGDGYDSYAWTGPDGFASTDQNPTANAAGTYSLVVTMNGCSSASVDVEVTGGGILDFSIVEGPATICGGGSTTFTSSVDDSNYTYLWTTDGGIVDTPNESSTSYTMGMPGTYTVSLVVTDGSGCTADAATVEVTVVEATDVPNPDDITICPATTTDIAGPDGYAAYSWDSGESTQAITVGAGTYTLTLTDNNGCTDDVTYTVVEGDGLDLPNPDPVSICAGSTTTISAPAGYDTYTWDSGEDTQDITVGAGTYVVTVSDGAGCSDDVTYVVTDDLSISIDTPDPVSICVGSTATISGPDGYASYSWDSGEDTQAITVGAGSYELTVTDASGCSASATYVINDDFTISINTPAPTTICPGSTTAISGPVGYASYSWNSGEDTQEITVGAGSYVLTVTNASGCSASATYVVEEGDGLDLPEPDATAICSGSSVTLTAPSGYTYLWADGSTGQTINVSAAGNYTVNVSDGAGCADDLTFAVSVLDTPNEPQPAPVAICSGDNAVLTAPAGYTYSWSNGSGEQSITVNQTGTYTVTIANGSCSQALDYVVSVGNTPAEPQPASITICEAGGSATLTAPAGYTYIWYNGSSDGSVVVSGSGSYDVIISNGACSQTLTYNVGIGGINEPDPATVSICAGSSTTLSAPPGYTYAWSNGSTAQTITVAAGEYAVTLYAGACSAVLNYGVTEVQPTAVGVSGSATQACPGTAITFTASGATNYSWTATGGTLNASTGGTVTFTAGSTAGTYSVTASSTDGCTTAGSATFNVLDGNVAPCYNPVPGSISGVVFDDLNGNGVQDPGEPGIGGVTVTATDANGNTITTTTNANGSYGFPGLTPGNYTVTVGAGPAGTTLTTSGSNTVIVVAGQNTNGGSFGFGNTTNNSIGDTVFDDTNQNGVQDAGEVGIAGVTVTIYDANGNVIGSTVTNANGIYTFPNLADGTYTVSVSVPGGSTLTTAGSYTVTVSNGQSYVNADFGIYFESDCIANSGNLTLLSSAGGTICGNGAITVQATGFTSGGIYGHIYVLTDENDIIVAASQTNGAFSGIAPGTYTVYSYSYVTANGTPAVGQDFFASYLSTMNCQDVSDGIPLSVAVPLNPQIIMGIGEDGKCNEDEASWNVTIAFPGAGPVSLAGAVNGSFGADQVVAFTMPENDTYLITVTDASGCTQNVYVHSGNCTKTSVELVDFDGRAENAGNYIFWSTASEVESKIFRVESSTNGIDFATVGTVNAAGNSNVMNSYDILDSNAAAGNTYYRLVEVDVYGTETVYNTISVYRESDIRTTITVAPVPVQNVLNIQLTNENPIDAQLQVFDMSGKVVKVVSDVNTTSITIDVVDLAAGTYFVVLTTATESTTTKFIKD